MKYVSWWGKMMWQHQFQIRCGPRWLVSFWAQSSSEVIPAQSQSKPKWINIQIILISLDKLADGSYVFYFCLLSSFFFLCFLSLDRSDIHLSLSLSPSFLHPEWVHYYEMSCISINLHMLITYRLLLHIQSSQPKTKKSNVSCKIEFKKQSQNHRCL